MSPEIRFYHYIIRRESIVAKISSGIPKNIPDEVIKSVYNIPGPQFMAFFSDLYQERGSQHNSPPFYMEVRPLSCRKVLIGVSELDDEA
jgi:hypothetical protein